MPLIVKVFEVVIFLARITVVPALIVTFSNVNDAELPLIVCEVPEKRVVPLFPALNVPFMTKSPPMVKIFLDVEIVPFALVVETSPPTVTAAFVEVAVSVDANVPPTERESVMVNVEVTVNVAALAAPLIVRDLMVMEAVSEG